MDDSMLNDKEISILPKIHFGQLMTCGISLGCIPFFSGFIEFSILLNDESYQLKFIDISNLHIDAGYHGSIHGMEILDISRCGWEGKNFEVRNFEQDPGISFFADSLIVLKNGEPIYLDKINECEQKCVFEKSDVSISLRFRKTILMEKHISVPVTETELLDPSNERSKIDVEKVFSKGLSMVGNDIDAWRFESQNTTIHPIQTPPKSL